ncbi:MAG: PKD domain-containing protein [candidate division Zixibacteria bacterium]
MLDIRKTLLMIIMALSSSAFAQSISGTVDANGGHEDNVAVQLYAPDGSPIGPYIDTTDILGFYSVSVDAGTYDISFRPGTSTGLIPVYLTDVSVNSNVTLDITLQNGHLFTGTVFDSQGNGIEDVDLNVYDQITGVQLFTPGDNTDVDGLYEIILPAGLFRVTYRYRGGISNPRYVAVEIENMAINSNTELDITLQDGFFITGTVIDLNDDPVTNADLDAKDSLTGIKVYTPSDNTDDNGDYQMLVPQGTYEINVAPLPETRLLPGIVYGVAVFGDITQNFVIEPGFLFYGTVRDPDGAGVTGVDLDIRHSNNGVDLFTPGDDTDEFGFYQVVLPQFGMYDVVYKPPVVPPYLAPIREDSVAVNSDTQLDVVLSTGILLYGTVLNSFGASVVDVDIDAIDVLSDLSVPLVGDHTDGLGQYQTVLAEGTYHLEFEPPRIRLLAATKLFDQSIFADIQYDVSLDTGMVVSGTITLENGTPEVDVRITAIESITQQEVHTPGNKSDVTGFYEILVKPETYDLTYSPDSLSDIPDTVTFTNVSVARDTVINIVYGLAPVANFSGDPVNGGVPLEVSFSDLSTNAPASWSWDFGDGGTSDLTNPTYVYQDAGTYTVTLTATNSYGTDMESKPDYIEVILAAPIADFVGSPLAGIPPMEVSFFDLSINGPTSWLWDFGDGGTSDLANPTHVYNELDHFTVTLTATNAYGSDIEIKTNYIFLSETGGCGSYVIGDYNGSESMNVADIISAFSKLKTGLPDAFLLCECPPGSGNTWAVAMDLNASCGFNVADVIAGFSKLKTGNPELFSCPSCPPGSPSPRRGNDILSDDKSKDANSEMK